MGIPGTQEKEVKTIIDRFTNKICKQIDENDDINSHGLELLKERIDEILNEKIKSR